MNLTALIPDTQFRYYRGLLSRDESAVYDTLLGGMLGHSDEIPCSGCTVGQIQKVYRCLKFDIPELFFVKDIRIRYTSPEATDCTVLPDYRFSRRQAYDTLAGMSERCAELFYKYENCDDFGKAQAIHDYLASTVTYRDMDAPYSHEAPGAILFGIGVCEGIAKAFKYLADRLELRSIVAFGSSSEQGGCGHAWNLACIDGTFYHIDTTFDTTVSSTCIRYDYFNLSDEDIRRTHSWSEPLPPCPRTYGLYEATNRCFDRGAELAAYIKRISPFERTFVFKLPAALRGEEGLLDSIADFIEPHIRCGVSWHKRFTLSCNPKQMVFQVDAG